MKDILRVMRFDFLTAIPVALTPLIICTLALAGIVLFLAPMLSGYLLFCALLFIIPLQSVAEKSGLHKLYGILPVDRKNITRGRFLLIFTLLFAAELLAIALVYAAMRLQLYRILPNQESEILQMASDTFDRTKFMNYGIIIFLFTIACLAFSFMEMTGQLFGRESDMKVILIVMGIVTVIVAAFSILSERGIVPGIDLESIGETLHRIRYPLSIGLNLGSFALCILFGEITAAKLAAREL